MRLIKEPLNVDFYFDGRQMNDDDQKRVSAFIARQKGIKKRRSLDKRDSKEKSRSKTSV